MEKWQNFKGSTDNWRIYLVANKLLISGGRHCSISRPTLYLLGFLLCLSTVLNLAESTCVWQDEGGMRLACGFKQSGLFRIRSFGGLKGWAGAGFTVADEDGFKDSLTNMGDKGQPGQGQQSGMGQSVPSLPQAQQATAASQVNQQYARIGRQKQIELQAKAAAQKFQKGFQQKVQQKNGPPKKHRYENPKSGRIWTSLKSPLSVLSRIRLPQINPSGPSGSRKMTQSPAPTQPYTHDPSSIESSFRPMVKVTAPALIKGELRQTHGHGHQQPVTYYYQQQPAADPNSAEASVIQPVAVPYPEDQRSRSPSVSVRYPSQSEQLNANNNLPPVLIPTVRRSDYPNQNQKMDHAVPTPNTNALGAIKIIKVTSPTKETKTYMYFDSSGEKMRGTHASKKIGGGKSSERVSHQYPKSFQKNKSVVVNKTTEKPLNYMDLEGDLIPQFIPMPELKPVLQKEDNEKDDFKDRATSRSRDRDETKSSRRRRPQNEKSDEDEEAYNYEKTRKKASAELLDKYSRKSYDRERERDDARRRHDRDRERERDREEERERQRERDHLYEDEDKYQRRKTHHRKNHRDEERDESEEAEDEGFSKKRNKTSKFSDSLKKHLSSHEIRQDKFDAAVLLRDKLKGVTNGGKQKPYKLILLVKPSTTTSKSPTIPERFNQYQNHHHSNGGGGKTSNFEPSKKKTVPGFAPISKFQPTSYPVTEKTRAGPKTTPPAPQLHSWPEELEIVHMPEVEEEPTTTTTTTTMSPTLPPEMHVHWQKSHSQDNWQSSPLHREPHISNQWPLQQPQTTRTPVQFSHDGRVIGQQVQSFRDHNGQVHYQNQNLQYGQQAGQQSQNSQGNQRNIQQQMNPSQNPPNYMQTNLQNNPQNNQQNFAKPNSQQGPSNFGQSNLQNPQTFPQSNSQQNFGQQNPPQNPSNFAQQNFAQQNQPNFAQPNQQNFGKPTQQHNPPNYQNFGQANNPQNLQKPNTPQNQPPNFGQHNHQQNWPQNPNHQFASHANIPSTTTTTTVRPSPNGGQYMPTTKAPVPQIAPGHQYNMPQGQNYNPQGYQNIVQGLNSARNNAGQSAPGIPANFDTPKPKILGEGEIGPNGQLIPRVISDMRIGPAGPGQNFNGPLIPSNYNQIDFTTGIRDPISGEYFQADDLRSMLQGPSPASADPKSKQLPSLFSVEDLSIPTTTATTQRPIQPEPVVASNANISTSPQNMTSDTAVPDLPPANSNIHEVYVKFPSKMTTTPNPVQYFVYSATESKDENGKQKTTPLPKKYFKDFHVQKIFQPMAPAPTTVPTTTTPLPPMYEEPELGFVPLEQQQQQENYQYENPEMPSDPDIRMDMGFWPTTAKPAISTLSLNIGGGEEQYRHQYAMPSVVTSGLAALNAEAESESQVEDLVPNSSSSKSTADFGSGSASASSILSSLSHMKTNGTLLKITKQLPADATHSKIRNVVIFIGKKK